MAGSRADPGDTVRLFIDGKPTTWRIAGIVEEGDPSGGVYTTPEGLAAATGQPALVHRVRLLTDQHDEATRDTVATTVDGALAAAGLDVEYASSVSRTDAASAGHMGPVLLVLLGIALALVAILGDGLGNLFGNAPLPYRISVLAVGLWAALAVLGAVLATEAAATRASRITVREALTYL